MKITISEVAKKSGVSISTVSRVLNDKDRVSEETRKRVQEVIQQLNYQPDQIARTMVKKETRTIGLVVPILSNEYWALFSEVVQEKLWERRYTLMLFSTGQDLQKEVESTKILVEKKVDGIIFAGFIGEENEGELPHLNQVSANGIPVVLFDRKIPGYHSIVGDHFQGTVDAVSHLIKLGHKKIAYIGGPAKDREWGYKEALRSHGIDCVDELIKKGNDFTVKFGFESVEELLNSKIEFSAIFCGNDLIALGAIQALEKANLNVPNDIAVIGFDDIDLIKFHKPALTTVRQPIREMGEEIVNMLLDLLETQDEVKTPKRISFQPQLIIRESCGSKITKKRS